MLYNSKEYGREPTRALKESLYNMDNDEEGIAPHPGHLFKLLKHTNFLLLTDNYFLLLG